MEFMNRSGQPRPSTNSTASTAGAPAQASSSLSQQPGTKPRVPMPNMVDRANAASNRGWFRWTYVALLFSVTALFIALLCYIVFGVPAGREAKFVDNNQYQAVFVNVNGTNGGQVYFGRIVSLTPQFIQLKNVFYIQNQQGQDTQSNSSYNLVKLGCELHGPEDEMIINRSEVFFWENLKSNSQVAQKAAEFYKQNPNGQKCSDTTNSTQQSSGSTKEAPAASGTTATPPAAATPPASATPPATGTPGTPNPGTIKKP